jgi:hypothetical protein
MVTEGQTRAWQMLPGSAIMLADENLNVMNGTVTRVRNQMEPCVRITTEAGISLVCSHTAPILTGEKTYLNAPEVIGKQVAVMIDGVTSFDNVVSVEDLGEREVRPLYAGDQNFWAGETEAGYILHHNMFFGGFGRNMFSIKKH